MKGTSLRTARLNRANLTGAQLVSADLSEASLRHAILVRADITCACFDRADLQHADLTKTAQDVPTSYSSRQARLSFERANLDGAILVEASLAQANLQLAVLTGADLTRANLLGADLRRARMDVATTLEQVKLDDASVPAAGKIRIADIVWNGAPLETIPWHQLDCTGDEGVARQPDLSRELRIQTYGAAARGYHSLQIALHNQGLADPGAKFHMREMEMERKRFWYERRGLQWLFSWLLKIVCGYGELPLRTALSYVVIVVAFGCAYFVLTNQLSNAADHLQWYDALLLSVFSFHGRGFFQVVYDPGDIISIPAAIEAIIGLFIEAIFIATFSRRFLNA